MIKIIGNDITRGGVKIGWVESTNIRDQSGRKLGYFSSNDIYRADGKKMGYIEGNTLYFSSGKTVSMDKVKREVSGGSIPNLARAAVKIIIGD
jgi:4-fold beta-flower domain-containing protein